MSSLLEQAIIDAKELREAALRFAENQVIERHAVELKEAIDSFLNEQDEPALDPMAAPAAASAPIPEDIPDASLVDTKTSSANSDQNEIILSIEELKGMLDKYQDPEIPVEDLKDPFQILAKPTEAQVEPQTTEVDLGSVKQPQTAPSTGMEGLMEDIRRFIMENASALGSEEEEEEEEEEEDEDEELDESYLRSLVEELVIDITDGDFTGWAGRPEKDRQYQEKIELARLADTKRQEELKDLQAGMKKLAGINESLKTQVIEAQDNNALLEQTILALKGKLEEVNLSNAKLLYQNEVLTNSSLNERQKTQVVESIRKAASVSEAKVIFETLQSAARSIGTDRKVESLNEAIRRPSHTIHGKRPLTESVDNSQLDYWKKLAGIQK